MVYEPTTETWTARHRHVDAGPLEDERDGLGWEVEGPARPGGRGQFALALDAHLTAASPELFRALRDLLAWADGELSLDLEFKMMQYINDPKSLYMEEVVEAALAALDKAQGKEEEIRQDCARKALGERVEADKSPKVYLNCEHCGQVRVQYKDDWMVCTSWVGEDAGGRPCGAILCLECADNIDVDCSEVPKAQA